MKNHNCIVFKPRYWILDIGYWVPGIGHIIDIGDFIRRHSIVIYRFYGLIICQPRLVAWIRYFVYFSLTFFLVFFSSSSIALINSTESVLHID